MTIENKQQNVSSPTPSNTTSSKKEKKELKKQCKSGSHDDSSDSEYIPGSESGYDTEDEKKQYKKFMKSLMGHDPDDEDSNSDSDDEDEYDTDEMEEMMKANKMNFNIVFTIGGKQLDEDEDEDDEDDSDDEDSDEDDEEEEKTGGLFMFDSKSKNKKLSNIITVATDENDEDDEDDEAGVVIVEKKSKKSKKSKPSEEESTPKPTVKTRSMTKKENSSTKSTKKTKQTSKKSSIPTEEEVEEKTKELTQLEEMMTVFNSAKTKDDAHKDLMEKFEGILSEKRKEKEEAEKKLETKTKSENLKKMKKLLREKNTFNEFKYFKGLGVQKQKNILKELELISKETAVDVPYKIQVIESDIPVSYKATALRKIDSLMYMDPGSGEYYKVKQWVDTFMKIPFGKYSSLPVNIDHPKDEINSFMENAKKTLDDCVYGLEDAKMQIMQMMGQWISNPEAVGTAIAIKGPMGTGKTTLVKEGISKILNRPFAFIALGGATDSSFLEGHSYTYEGSIWGKIVDILIHSKSMNPVIYFDELDKVSDTAKGEEIIGILTHLTDTTQNSQFHDKYFSNIDFDLSKALFIFSYNDERKVNPILRDRMYRIETAGYGNKDKSTIAKQYLIPSIEHAMNFKDTKITLSNKVIELLCNEYTHSEKGVRNLKRCLEIIYSKLNLFRLMKPDTSLFNKEDKTYNVGDEFEINEEVVRALLKKEESDRETFYRNMFI